MQAPQHPYGAMPNAQAQLGGQAQAPKRYDGENGVPNYDPAHGGHYGASAAIAANGHAPPAETFQGHWGNVSGCAVPPTTQTSC
jgi:nuclear transcription factor Y gamma